MAWLTSAESTNLVVRSSGNTKVYYWLSAPTFGRYSSTITTTVNSWVGIAAASGASIAATKGAEANVIECHVEYATDGSCTVFQTVQTASAWELDPVE